MKREKFINRATAIHGDLYDYSLVSDDMNIKDKYKIICFIHGKFEQRGDSHLGGSGCGKCKNSVLKTVDEFIDESNIIFNYRYDYSDVKYINCKTKIDIICPINGVFQLTPDNHLSGHGCSKCAFDTNSKKMKDKAASIFEEKSNIIHNNKYR